MQGQVRLNGFRRCSRRFRRRPGRLWCREGSAEGSGRLWCRVPEKVSEKVWEALEHAEVFPALGFAECCKKIGKNKTLRLLGIPPKLIFNVFKQFLVVSLENQPDNVHMPKNGWKFIDVLPNIAQMNPKTHIT